MYNSFELFFFWRKCSTVVAVGVQTSFLPFAKSVTEKNNSRVDCAEADKKTVQALRFGMLSELTRKGGDFWRLGICPAELPVINFQAKPDHLNLRE
jgi:hypothetical protein